jgi:uncharacterized protein (DUF3820 family)
MLNQNQSKQFLVKLANTKMPYGKYKGRFMIDLPEYYIVWYRNKGFPKGQIGEMLSTVYELKVNGLEELVRNIQRTS